MACAKCYKDFQIKLHMHSVFLHTAQGQEKNQKHLLEDVREKLFLLEAQQILDGIRSFNLTDIIKHTLNLTKQSKIRFHIERWL